VPEFSESVDLREVSEPKHSLSSQEGITKILQKRAVNLLHDEGMGLQRREASADHQSIPLSLLNALPQGIREGRLDAGFGVGGGTGIGKTQAVAALVIKAFTENPGLMVAEPPELWHFPGKRHPSICTWSCWSSELTWLRAHVTQGAQDRIDNLNP
jgi:hypothetical protein